LGGVIVGVAVLANRRKAKRAQALVQFSNNRTGRAGGDVERIQGGN